MIGKRIGIQPTARFVLDAILSEERDRSAQMTITNVGFDMTPLAAGAGGRRHRLDHQHPGAVGDRRRTAST